MSIKLEKPTQEQIAIYGAFEEVRDGRSNGFAVNAKAGSGKTSTAVASVDAFPKGSAMVAFNKSIADELVSRLGGRVPASTFHGLGLSQLRQRMSNVRPDSHKISKLCRNHFNWGFLYRPYADVVENIMTYGEGIGNEDLLRREATYLDALGHSGAFVPEGLELQVFLGRCQELMLTLLDDNENISFPEMLYKPLLLAKRYKWNLQTYSTLIIDEAQDVSRIRRWLAKAVAPKMIPIGDPDQAIYGFAGAEPEVFNRMVEEEGLPTYPLSISWRCSRAVIIEAQSIVGDCIHASPTASQGHVGFLEARDFFGMPESENDFVLCRTNAPLIRLAMRYLRQGSPFQLRSDFAERLLQLAKKLAKGCGGKAAYNTSLELWGKDQKETFKDSAAVCRRIDEQVECLQVVLSMSDSVEDMLLNLELMLNSSFGPILMTIHKSKGLEAKRVFLIRPDYLPAPWVEPTDIHELQQESNLKYVAVTRAIDEFYYVEGDI